MYDTSALNLSNKNLPDQIEYVKKALPYIREIHLTDSKNNMAADYLYSIDGHGYGAGKSYTIQFKSRQPNHNDIVIPALKLSGKAAEENNSLGFWSNGSKYILFPQTDIFCETLGDGKTVVFTREELEAIQATAPEGLEKRAVIQPKYIKDDNGEEHFSGEYYCFLSQDSLTRLQLTLLLQANPDAGKYMNY